jgi:hypothetical protein
MALGGGNLEERLVRALEDIAETNKRMATAAETAVAPDVAIDGELFDVPACPHCSALNPPTRMSGGEGRLNEFVLVTPCGECGETFYAVPMGWRITADREEAGRLIGGGK